MDYTPEVAEFDSATDLYVFDDGWKVVEVQSKGDLATLGRITKNCIGISWHCKLLPAPEDERAALRESFRKTWDTPHYREARGDEWVERQVAGADKCPLPQRSYKIAALVNEENRPYAAIILGEEKAVQSACTYSSYRDLGQDTCITVDGLRFILLQITWGIAWMPEDCAHRCATWWQSEADGDWDEEKFQAKVDYYNHGKIGFRAGLAYR